MVDFSKHQKGDVVAVHCCDSCARQTGATPKAPADSGAASWPCYVCGHYGIGSLTDCEIGDWLVLRPLRPVAMTENKTMRDRIKALENALRGLLSGEDVTSTLESYAAASEVARAALEKKP